MKLVRFFDPELGSRLGLVKQEQVYDLTAFEHFPLASLSDLLIASVDQSIVALIAKIDTEQLPVYNWDVLNTPPLPDRPHLLAPIDRQEVWAAGVTYAWSREARVREAVSKDIYVRVYEAERPELFFKSLPDKVVGPNDWVGIRGDSQWNVPEPEFALLINPALQIVGCTIGNDMSSRDIEGENPLYLPQAKVYRRSCALGPAIKLIKEPVDILDCKIHLEILRDGVQVFVGDTNTNKIHRSLPELAGWLGRYYDLPYGAYLLTGTGIVPPDDFTLQENDLVLIDIEGIGRLENAVRCL